MNFSIRLCTLIVISAFLCCNREQDDGNEFPEIPDDNFWIMLIMQGVDCLDLSGLTHLSTLECSQNELSDLDLSDLTNLNWLYCGVNQLTNIIFPSNPKIWSLNCADNQLSSLDVSGFEDLGDLFCNDNQLTSLNVSKDNFQRKTIFV